MAPSEPNTIDANGYPRTDFSKAFQDGYQFQYDLPHSGLQTVEFTTHQIDDLVLPSGQIVACDPSISEDFECTFTQSVKPGCYPIFLSLAGFKPERDRRIACAMLQFNKQMPLRWDLATLEPSRSAEYQNYGVDSGTGCFMDAEGASALLQFENPNSDVYARALQKSRDVGWEARRGTFDPFWHEYWEVVIEQMESNTTAAVSDEYLYDRKGGWANFCIDENTGANVVAFNSGWGDGGYASYWGYGADGEIACLVTDFELFRSNKV
ncbi:DUF4241 domain-containing protein [Oscillatoria sp. CS-180]|uniref:DUF4241 domain-containing protein n=1 Tax=Oscillatoria sp. CS-180 TaxID=3021720 RepID=UPI00232F730F|nr:DUF4241 domain-containing protein [Oscillatoria sp. CS-180]MDB9527506.1 DUF4241 domain-containing protein [Oscillatoria sp. CS-180]